MAKVTMKIGEFLHTLLDGPREATMTFQKVADDPEAEAEFVQAIEGMS